MPLLEWRVGGLVLIAALVASVAGCGPRPLAPEPAAPPATVPAPVDVAACALLEGPGAPIATVALGQPVDPVHAPYPTNDSERLLFRQLYETLVDVDCEGGVRPGLAASWRREGGSHAWIVTVRDAARFSDGTPVTPAALLSSWSREGIGDELRPEVSRHVESIVPVDERTLAITLRDDRPEAPVLLAHTDLAIAMRSGAESWPYGTRGARVVPESPPADRRGDTVLTLVRATEGVAAADSASAAPIRFLVAPARDLRDFLDGGVDLLVTRDPAALEYAATLPQFQSVPLEWHRTHVFVSAWRERTQPPLPAGARHALAGAVRGDARGAEEPFWWQAATCETTSPARPDPPRPGSPANGRIVYEEGDDASRDLAERLVGLARVAGPEAAAVLGALLPGPPAQRYQRAIGLGGEALASALARGTDAGYIMPLDRHPLHACEARRTLTDRLGWLDPEAIVPMIDTRLQAIVRRGRIGVTVEWDGTLLLTGAGDGR